MEATLKTFEKLLREAQLPDLAEKVGVWDVDTIYQEAKRRKGFCQALAVWHISWVTNAAHKTKEEENHESL